MAGHVPPSGAGGGIVRYTVELAHALERREDVQLHLLTSRDAAGPLGDLIGCGERVVELREVPDPLLPSYERYLLGRALGSRFDVVQGAKHLLPRNVDAQTVLTVHDMLLFDRPADFPMAKRYLLRQPYAASVRQADTLVCVSEATRLRLAHWLPSAADHAAVVSSATSSHLLAADPVPVEAVSGRVFGLVVGDPSPRKNLAVVVSAWAEVVRTRPDAVLVLVGPPAWGTVAYGPAFDALVASGNVVQLVGVDDGTLRWCYDNAAVVLAPSLAEGFGLPAIEALDLGAPLVTSVDPALVEVSGDEAVHLPFDDVSAWAGVVLQHLDGPPRGRPATERRRRSWDDVAAETVEAVVAGGRKGVSAR